jgi:hypothetical protein
LRPSAGIAERPPAGEAGGRGVGLLWGGVALALLALGPFGEGLAANLPGCFFRSVTGFPCPTCGGTRAALALARFDFPTAFHSNPLLTLALLFLVGGGLAAGAVALAGRGVREPARVPGWVRAGLVLVLAANWFFLIVDGR